METTITNITLPAHWAGYLINNDADGLTPEDVAEIRDPLKTQYWLVQSVIAVDCY